jgi:hypothetical protein
MEVDKTIMEQINSKSITIDTVGGGGVAVGSGVIEGLYGFLLDIYLDFHASAPGTTDTTIVDDFGNVLVVSNSSTDALYSPRREVHDTSGAGASFYDYITLNGSLTISVAGCDQLTGAVTVTVQYLNV